jgi:hypothetical protein
MPTPDFLIIGAAKSGTTSLISDIRNHPDVYAHAHEINYFSHHIDLGNVWYESLFTFQGKVQGEKSTSYMYEKHSHELIFHHNPGMKLIMILREPVKRAFSNWTMRFNQSRLLKQADTFNKRYHTKIDNIGFSHLYRDYLTLRTDEIRIHEPLDIFERGLYIEQIDHLLRFFPPVQMLVLISEQYFHQPEVALKKVSRFLEIGDFPDGQATWKRKTEYPIHLDERLSEELQRFYEPYNKRLFEFMGAKIDEWKL